LTGLAQAIVDKLRTQAEANQEEQRVKMNSLTASLKLIESEIELKLIKKIDMLERLINDHGIDEAKLRLLERGSNERKLYESRLERLRNELRLMKRI
jgi:hypothetical protein